ncbi:MAG: tetratricopeptide repeat protein [Fimbriimonadaceae bacterium]|nr:tetratricopeptide repeat protein [Fimbriimonadaceae bacterium]
MGLASILPTLSLILVGQSAKPAPKPAPKIDALIDVAVYNRLSTQGDVWFEDGDYPRVIELLRYQVELYPSDYDLATNLGWLLESTERPEEATKVYIAYAKRNPNDPDALLPEAQQYFLKRKYDQSLAVALRGLNGPNAKRAHPNLYRIAANSYERLGKFAESEKIWDRYLKLNPDDASALNRRATVRKKQGKN